MRTLSLFGILIALASTSMGATRDQVSALWPGHAASNASDRLPDFSHAGYLGCAATPPVLPVRGNVRDFGAKGDGATDDTAAFRKAITAVTNGALLVPAGRYVIRDFLKIEKSNFALRGEGPDRSVLFFPVGLEDIHSKPTFNTGGTPTTDYSWSGGYVTLNGSIRTAHPSPVRSVAPHGSRELDVAGSSLATGDDLFITQRDDGDLSFVSHLYAGDPGDTKKVGARTSVSMLARVVSVQSNRLVLDRALPIDVRPQWQASAAKITATVTNSGVERLTFEFPVTPYKGHFKERGYNPLAFGAVMNCWATDLRFVNADSGPFVGGRQCTLQRLTWASQRPADRTGCTGHHGISLGGSENLLVDFDFRTKFIHDLTVSADSHLNVFSRGKGVDLSFDHHKRAPFANLFTEIDAGAGTRLFHSGGGDALGRNSGAWTTLWNIHADRPQSWPPKGWCPDLFTMVGVTTTNDSITSKGGKWFEAIDPARLTPANLFDAQRAQTDAR